MLTILLCVILEDFTKVHKKRNHINLTAVAMKELEHNVEQWGTRVSNFSGGFKMFIAKDFHF